MIFTWYFIGLIFGLAMAELFLPVGWYLLYTLIVLVFLWAVDAWFTLKKYILQAERSFPNPIYQNQTSSVELIVTNRSGFAVKAYFKDEPPFIAETQGHSGWLVIPAKGAAIHSYSILSPKRGIFSFGVLNLKVAGRLQLFSWHFKIAIPQELKVFPDLTKIKSGRLARFIGSETAGLRRQKMFGVGGELAELREFVQGDDYRKINWKVTAHRGKPIVNQYEPEKDQNVFMLFDTGRLLFDQSNERDSRFDHILDSAILLAFNIQEYGDMLGAFSFNCKIERFVPFGKGHYHLQLLINQLYDLKAVMVESDYREAFSFLQTKINKRCLIFVYTDLLDSESSKDLINYLKIISRHHLVVCVLSHQSNIGKILENPITDEKSAFLKGTALELLAEREGLKRTLTSSGIKILEVNPSNIRRSVVEHYIYLKDRGLF